MVVDSKDNTEEYLDIDKSIEAIALAFKKNVKLEDRRYYLKTYKNSFVGTAAVSFLVDSGYAASREDAVRLGQILASEYHLFEHVTRDHPFKDEDLFYRFYEKNERGTVKTNEVTGEKASWSDFLAPASNSSLSKQQPSLPIPDFEAISENDTHVASVVWPLDQHNTTLLNHVHPPNWQDPNAGEDSDKTMHYDLVVIGGGTGGLITAAGAAGVGAKVAMIEEHMLGGDCLNVGCVPSKAIIHSANLAHTLRGDVDYLSEAGLSVDPAAVKIDFEKVMERVRKLRAKISHLDSAERYSQELGVEVYIGRGVFASERTVCVNGRTLRFKKAVIATGGYPALIPMPGLKDLHKAATGWNTNNTEQPRPQVMTNETVFNLTKRPERMVVIGAGVIGLELAQAFQRLGVDVTVTGRSGRVLPKEDADLAAIIKDQMVKDGVNFRLSVAVYEKIELTGRILDSNGYPEMEMAVQETNTDGDTVQAKFTFDAILVAAGRRPNVTGMNCEAAKVAYDTRLGISTNDYLQSPTNPRVYAVGDCASVFKFTHAADFMARAVIRNSLFFGKEKISNLLIPYATFTSPEIASVGLYESDLKAKGVAYKVVEKHFKDNDRAVLENATVGMVRLRVDARTDQILGASIVGAGAGNMISEVTLAMQSGTGLTSVASVIHPYPTTAEAIRQAGDIHNKARLTTTVKSLLRGVVKLQS